MKKSRSEMKRELMKVAEQTIDQLLDWTEEIEQPNLSQIETVVLGLRQKLSEKMSEAVIEHQAGMRPVPGPGCGQCRQEMRYQGQYAKRVTSWVGEIKLERAYYDWEQCHSGLFPPGLTT